MSNRFFRTSGTLLIALSFAACSSGSPSLVPNAPAGGQGATQKHPQGSAKAEIVIRWRSRHRAKHARHTFFVSPSAQSIWVNVAPAGKPSAAKATIVNRGKSLTSTIALDAPLGRDTFTFEAYDRKGAQGNELGGATVQQRIVAGKANTVGATLEGYASTFAITSQDSRFAPASGSSTAYLVAGEGQYTFRVAPVDADGNVILSPGAPALSVTSDTPYFQVARVKGKANTYTIQAAALITEGSASYKNPQLTVSAPGAASTTAMESFGLNEVPLLYATAGSGSSAHVYAYDSLDNQYTLPEGSFAGLSKPVAVAYNPTARQLYIADAGTNSVLAFDESGAAVSGWAAPSVQGLTGIAFSPHQNHIYVTSTANGGRILVFDTTGASVSTSGFTGLHGPPVGIAYLPAPGLNIGLLTASGAVTFIVVNNPVAVVESSVNGNPGYFDVFGDDGTYQAAFSSTLKDAVTHAAFNPTGIGTGNTQQYSQSAASGAPQGVAPGFWITGSDVGTTTPIAAMVCYSANCTETPYRAGAVPVFLGGNQNNFLNDYVGGGSTATNISAPISTVLNPVTGDTYVVNGPGGTPNGGLTGFVGAFEVNAEGADIQGVPPVFLGTQPVAGDAPIIGPPSGVTNFTAAAFTEF